MVSSFNSGFHVVVCNGDGDDVIEIMEYVVWSVFIDSAYSMSRSVSMYVNLLQLGTPLLCPRHFYCCLACGD